MLVTFRSQKVKATLWITKKKKTNQRITRPLKDTLHDM